MSDQEKIKQLIASEKLALQLWERLGPGEEASFGSTFLVQVQPLENSLLNKRT
jgi:hypothetical protein